MHPNCVVSWYPPARSEQNRVICSSLTLICELVPHDDCQEQVKAYANSRANEYEPHQKWADIQVFGYATADATDDAVVTFPQWTSALTGIDKASDDEKKDEDKGDYNNIPSSKVLKEKKGLHILHFGVSVYQSNQESRMLSAESIRSSR